MDQQESAVSQEEATTVQEGKRPGHAAGLPQLDAHRPGAGGAARIKEPTQFSGQLPAAFGRQVGEAAAEAAQRAVRMCRGLPGEL